MGEQQKRVEDTCLVGDGEKGYEFDLHVKDTWDSVMDA